MRKRLHLRAATCLLLRRFDSVAKKVKQRETGDEHARDHGKEKEERRNILSPSLPPLRAHHFRSERDVWERGRAATLCGKTFNNIHDQLLPQTQVIHASALVCFTYLKSLKPCMPRLLTRVKPFSFKALSVLPDNNQY